MSTVLYFWHHLEEFPEYLPGLAAAFTILIVALPIYLGILFFLYRRRLHFAVRHHVAFLSVPGWRFFSARRCPNMCTPS